MRTYTTSRTITAAVLCMTLGVVGCSRCCPSGAPAPETQTPASASCGVTSLKLDNTATDDAELIAAIQENPRLEELTLTATQITDAGVAHLAVAGVPLKRLRLSKTAITDSALTALAKLTTLVDLDISQTSIGDAGVVHLAALPNLKKLNLYSTTVTNASAETIAIITTLTWLNIDKCPVGDAMIPAVASLPHLEWLHLGRTQITDAALHHLKTTLKEVSITNTVVTPEGVARLRLQLPHCLIHDNVIGNAGE